MACFCLPFETTEINRKRKFKAICSKNCALQKQTKEFERPKFMNRNYKEKTHIDIRAELTCDSQGGMTRLITATFVAQELLRIGFF